LAKSPEFYKEIRSKVIKGRKGVFDMKSWMEKYERTLQRVWEIRLSKHFGDDRVQKARKEIALEAI